MSQHDVLLTEQYGSLGIPVNYRKIGQNEIIVQQTQTTIVASVGQWLGGFFRDVFLPHGYPDSVSEDYLEYQLWDTIQAFCSTITGIFTTQAILKGVGVGNAEASALSATITWILKDGTGMVGRIVFAWWKGRGLDANCKRWRLFADFLNDGAMLLELAIPYFPDSSMPILCLSTTLKAVVGVAGGATRASITQHQAIRGNMAEISAKDGSQETLVNLIASCTGIFILNYIDFSDYRMEWCFVSLLIFLHLLSNYRAITVLIFKNFNTSRMNLVLKDYLVLNAAPNPQRTNEKESVILGCGVSIGEICSFEIVMGKSLKKISKIYDYDDLENLATLYKRKKYIIAPEINSKKIYVAFVKDETSEDVITAYFNAVLIGIATCIYNNFPLDIYLKRQLRHSSPIIRLNSFMKTVAHNTMTNPENIPRRLLNNLDDFIDQEIKMFFTALEVSGWKTDVHSMEIDEWRTKWLNCDKKML